MALDDARQRALGVVPTEVAVHGGRQSFILLVYHYNAGAKALGRASSNNETVGEGVPGSIRRTHPTSVSITVLHAADTGVQ